MQMCDGYITLQWKYDGCWLLKDFMIMDDYVFNFFNVPHFDLLHFNIHNYGEDGVAVFADGIMRDSYERERGDEFS